MEKEKQANTGADASVSFKDLGVSENILAVLEKNNFTTPTPIQGKVIPDGTKGKDIIGIAQTGTGKTLGFGIPMIERVIKENALGLVLLPTRELALQVDETFRKVGGPLGIRTVVLIGGEPINRQIRALKFKPDVVIATPGRLIDHLSQGTIKLDHVSIVVLDEADHMFDIGFMPQIQEIMKKVPKGRQTLLFSATMPEAIAKLAIEHMTLPLRIEVARQGTAAHTVDQEIIVVERKAKFNLLVKILGEEGKGTPVLVFTRTKYGAKNIAHELRNVGITSAEIHSNRSLGQRKEALEGFKKHKYQVLVATDIAARGIDVKDISLVVNYDLPEQSEDYVHRIGRTGRAGKTGKAVSFATPDQRRDIMDIERLIQKAIPVKSHEGATMGAYTSDRPRRGHGHRAFGPHGAGRGGFHRGPHAPRSPHSRYPGHSSHSSHSSHAPHSRGGFKAARFNSKFPRPAKTDRSGKESLGSGYRRVFRKGVR